MGFSVILLIIIFCVFVVIISVADKKFAAQSDAADSPEFQKAAENKGGSVNEVEHTGNYNSRCGD